MRIKLLTLRFAETLGGFDDRPLDEFVRDKEVLAIREHFFVVHDLPHLACLVTYQAARVPARTAERPPREPRADEPELTDEQRTLFTTLREWRNATARRDGLPPYVILNNRELAGIVRAKPTTPSALAALPGIGAGKVERYGRAILAKLHGELAVASSTP